MKIDNNIKAIIFDSGYTLNEPKTGNWFIPPNFFVFVDRTKLVLDSANFSRAFHLSYRFLMQNHCIKTEQEEFLQFKQFYSILLKECEYPCIDDDLISAVAEDNVYNDEKFVFFDDVESSLRSLYQGYKLGLVSDTWPSLERVFINKGIRQYFSCFVMSSVHGVCKSNKILFETALKDLDVEPFEAIFIDDSENNLNVAREVGLIPIRINRGKQLFPVSNYTVISTLKDLIS